MKMECRQIDELMMDYLYQELDPAQMAAYRSHLAGCPQCAAQLAVHERTRAAVRMLPELDPPSSVTAKLLEAAAQRAVAPAIAAVGAAGSLDSVAGTPPARAGGGGGRVAQVAAEAGEKKGLWGWLTGVLQPIAAHPGFAAAAGLVLVGSVAGLLAMRGVVSEKAAAPSSVRSPAAEQAHAETLLQEKAAAAPSFPAVGGAAPAAVPPGDVATAAPGAPREAEKLEFYRSQEDAPQAELVAPGPRARLATPEEQGIIAGGRTAGGGAVGGESDDSLAGDKGYAGGLGGDLSRDRAPEPRDRAAKAEGAASGALAPRADGAGAPSRGASGASKDAKPSASVGSAAAEPPKAPAPTTAPKQVTRQPAAKPSKEAAPAPPAEAPMADLDAEMAPSSPSAGAPMDEAEGRAAEKKKGKASLSASEQEARKLHGQARAKANTGDCASALKLRTRIYRTDPSYFDRSVKNDDELNRCTASGTKRPARKNDANEAPAAGEKAPPAPAKPADSK